MGMEPFDLNIVGGKFKWTTLHLAAFRGQVKIVEEILCGSIMDDNSFQVNLYARTQDGETPKQVTKGNLILIKIINRYERHYSNTIFDFKEISDLELI
jgi:hypothetical protein